MRRGRRGRRTAGRAPAGPSPSPPGRKTRAIRLRLISKSYGAVRHDPNARPTARATDAPGPRHVEDGRQHPQRGPGHRGAGAWVRRRRGRGRTGSASGGARDQV